MNNIVIYNTVQEILNEMVQNKKIFTGYEVTLAVRKKLGTKIDNPLYHSDIKSIIEDKFTLQAMLGYNKKLCSLNTKMSKKIKAFVYYPDGSLVSDHPLVSNENNTIIDLEDDEYRVTVEGRVNIPKEILSNINITAGNYDVYVDGDLKFATPNKDGRVRVYIGKNCQKVKIFTNDNKKAIEIESI